MSYIRQIETSFAIITLRKDNLIEIREPASPLKESSIEIAKELMSIIADISGGKKRKMIAYMPNRILKKEERKFYANHPTPWITHIALIVDNPYKSILGNLFMGLNKLQVPSKLFTTEENAQQWLQNQIKMKRDV